MITISRSGSLTSSAEAWLINEMEKDDRFVDDSPQASAMAKNPEAVALLEMGGVKMWSEGMKAEDDEGKLDEEEALSNLHLDAA